jgi:membrane protease YdiL (CAAX protease family)
MKPENAIRTPRYVDSAYDDIIGKFSKTDGALAILVYVMCVAYIFFGFWVVSYVEQFPLTIVGAVTLVALVFSVLFLRKQSLNTIGFNKNNWVKSLLIGLTIGLVVFIARTFGIVERSSLSPSFGFVYAIFHYFLVVSAHEEIVFRGFIQTRLYSIVKLDFAAVFVGGVLFAAPHLLSYFIAGKFIEGFEAGTPFSIFYSRFMIPFTAHILLNYLYRKYNSLIGPIVLHGFVNLYFN